MSERLNVYLQGRESTELHHVELQRSLSAIAAEKAGLQAEVHLASPKRAVYWCVWEESKSLAIAIRK